MNSNSVYKDAARVSIVIFILGLIEFGVFAIFKMFSYDVPIGILYGCAFASVNFFYLAYCVNKSSEKSESAAQGFMSMSYSVRIFLTAAMIFIASKVSFINIWAAIIPLFFPRVAILVITLLKKRGE